MTDHRPTFFEDQPGTDRLLAMIVALTGEVSALRERLDTHERLASTHVAFDRATVDTWRADAAAAMERHADRQALIERVFSGVVAELDALLTDERAQDRLSGAEKS